MPEDSWGQSRGNERMKASGNRRRTIPITHEIGYFVLGLLFRLVCHVIAIFHGVFTKRASTKLKETGPRQSGLYGAGLQRTGVRPLTVVPSSAESAIEDDTTPLQKVRKSRI